MAATLASQFALASSKDVVAFKLREVAESVSVARSHARFGWVATRSGRTD